MEVSWDDYCNFVYDVIGIDGGKHVVVVNIVVDRRAFSGQWNCFRSGHDFDRQQSDCGGLRATQCAQAKAERLRRSDLHPGNARHSAPGVANCLGGPRNQWRGRHPTNIDVQRFLGYGFGAGRGQLHHQRPAGGQRGQDAIEELQFSIDGKTSVVIDTTGKALADIAEAINQKVPELNASVISTTSGYYLNVARKSTGYATTADAALTIVSDPGLVLVSQQLAKNAKLTIDGLSVERQSNAITDVVRGSTLHLTGFSGLDNQVTFAANSANTSTALNTFVSAYNTLSATVRSQLVTDPTVAYGATLLSHSTTTTIQSAMQRMLSQMVVPMGSVRILADLGLELQRDGSLTLNTTTMNNAITSNPGAVNGLFSTTATGIGDVVKQLVTSQTNVATGALITQQQSLQSNITDMDLQATEMQSNLDMERARLVTQFTAMEQLIAGFTSAGSYLTQMANQKISG
jgi:flagellar capping protein FliD